MRLMFNIKIIYNGINMAKCTFLRTGNKYEKQIVGQCFDCMEESNHAIYLNCLHP